VASSLIYDVMKTSISVPHEDSSENPEQSVHKLYEENPSIPREKIHPLVQNLFKYDVFSLENKWVFHGNLIYPFLPT